MKVLAEGRGWIAVDKPAGVVVVPARDEDPEGCLRRVVERERGEPLWVVHRLDRGTSGIVLFARNPEAHRALGAEAARAGVRLLGAFGPRSREVLASARAAGLPEEAGFHSEEVEPLAAFLRARIGPGDVVLVKGSRGMRLERLIEALR